MLYTAKMPSLKDKHIALAGAEDEEITEEEKDTEEEDEEDTEEEDEEDTEDASGETASSNRSKIIRKRGRPTKK